MFTLIVLLLWSVKFSECQHSCNGILYTDPAVCSGNGECTSQDVCICELEYYGIYCESVYYCYGISALNSSVCSGHGVCLDNDLCDCDLDYTGDECEYYHTCGGILHTDPAVCSGNGNCTASDTCVCEPDWTGDICNEPICVVEGNTTISESVWLSGNSTVNQPGVYGTKGVPSTYNYPGARIGQTMTSNEDSVFLFGGEGYDEFAVYGLLNDLWMYNITTKEWTWVSGNSTVYEPGVYGTKGFPSVYNYPGSRKSHSMTSNENLIFLFGGEGYSLTAGYLEDLMMYNIYTSEWTWLSGRPLQANAPGIYGTKGVSNTSNYPGSRKFHSMTSNEESIFVFGGEGYDEFGSLGTLNDLWMYNKNWTWLSGFSTRDEVGVYGSKGDPSVYNYPGARYAPTMISNENSIFLFGGSDKDWYWFNDMWKYNITSTEWTWVSGLSITDQFGVYGTKGAPSISNYPGSREHHSMTSIENFIFVFGGYGLSEFAWAYLNDLWMYNIYTTEWAWLSGNSTVDEPGVYGTKGLPSVYNYPGSRYLHSMTSNENSLFLFGGYGYDKSGPDGWLNDLWGYVKNSYIGMCFGKYSANVDICSGNGVCVDEDDCCCDFGCSGPECGTCYCYETLSTDPNVCSEHGSCTGFDVCTCYPGYYGDECESEYYCYGTLASESSVCSSHGVCIGNDTCDCDSGYGGDSCSQPICYGLIEPLVCSERGNCTSPDVCTCDPDWTGDTCNLPRCDPECDVGKSCTSPGVCTCNSGYSQWTWISGNSTSDEYGVYGTKGVPSVYNYPGSRYHQTTASYGDVMYLFGGYGYGESDIGRLNDLWMYNTSTTEWTWLSGNSTIAEKGVYGTKGEPSIHNYPGARISFAMTSNENSLFLFGGNGYDESGSYGRLNDLWMYNITTKEWAWLSGNSTPNEPGVYGTKGVPNGDNYPGARFGHSMTLNENSIYIFGGEDNNVLLFTDLWMYNITSTEWTWVSGLSTKEEDGVYGTKGVSNTSNYPGSRKFHYMTSNENFIFLFGGFGYAEFLQWLNDLWMYNIDTTEWTWVSGNSTFNQLGVYGTKGVPSTYNYPGAREKHRMVSNEDFIYLFGGHGVVPPYNLGYFNDLWVYNKNTKEWTWLSGSSTGSEYGVYGTKGSSSILNHPGSRSYASIALNENIIFMFGGLGYTESGQLGHLNDLWEYHISVCFGKLSFDVDVCSGNGNCVYDDCCCDPGYGGDDCSQTTCYGFLGTDPAVCSGYGNCTSPDVCTCEPDWTGDICNERICVVEGNTTISGPVWLSGNSTVNQPGVYGTKGVPSVYNYPGARQYHSMTSNEESIFVFGGRGYDNSSIYGYINDLWRYNIPSAEWTWVSGNSTVDELGVYGTKGFPSVYNYPGARDSHSMTSYEEGIYIFGGQGYDISSYGYLNDLWRYNINTEEWTWLSGSNTGGQLGVYGTKGNSSIHNYPGDRIVHSMTSNEESIFIFGGIGYAESSIGWLNDLWMYNKNTTEWTWISGNLTIDEPGVYGTKGEPSVHNYPGARESPTMISNEDCIFLFGGADADWYWFNDMWKYNITSTEWTWVSGLSITDQFGVYGTKRVPSTSNYPGSRVYHSMTSNGEFIYIFGGYGYSESSAQWLNDLWMYNMDTTEWTWVSGNSTVNSRGVYGTKGFPSVYNYPGSRYLHSMTSNEDFIFLFGGYGFDESWSLDSLNDLWMYNKNIYAGMCFGKFPIDFDVCSGNGVCVDEDNCCCDFGCSGPECGDCYCYEIFGTDPEVCSEHGSCTGFNVCSCDPGYYGDECESEYYCYGIPASNSSVCSGYGVCIGTDNCDCDPGYGGDSCSQFVCYGLIEPLVCSEHGNCTSPDVCTCDPDWTGDTCNLPVCDPECVIGKSCTSPGVCTCDSGYQAGWTWVSGNSSAEEPGVYGTKGDPSIHNYPGNRRYHSMASNENSIYMFGGQGVDEFSTDGTFNDLWMYNITTTEWTWLSGNTTVTNQGVYGTKGEPSIHNYPGCKRYSTMALVENSIFLFGGLGLDAYTPPGQPFGILNDMWMYNISSTEWAWVSGNSTMVQKGVYGTKGSPSVHNYPGSRDRHTMISNENLIFLFGGQGVDTNGVGGVLNALWMYNTSSKEWTWLSGNSTGNQIGVYGTKGNPSIYNYPGARRDHSMASNENLIFLFGGADAQEYWFDDMWMYNITSTEWTWVSGTTGIPPESEVVSVYGTKGVPSTSNYPGSRRSNSMSSIENFIFLFGGYGYADTFSIGYINDLWVYNTDTTEWSWVSGNSTINELGVYGIKEVSSIHNYPGSRSSHTMISNENSIFLFGGLGYAESSSGSLNDLWEYYVGMCFGKLSIDVGVCSGNGNCVYEDNCCCDPGYYGDECNRTVYECYGLYEDDPYVCSERGECIGNDTCDCDPGYSGDECESEYYCYGFLGTDPLVCSGYGNCIATDTCVCEPDWTGDICNEPVCVIEGSQAWIWVSGNSTADQPGVYGIKGVPSTSNYPGSRFYHSMTSNGEFIYIFGGEPGFDFYLNDLWSYNINTTEWTWVSGLSTSNNNGVYGTKGVPSVYNYPGSRQLHSMTSTEGFIFIFGGLGYAESGSYGRLNDLWMYNITTKEWVWLSGSNTRNQPGVYGTKGNSSISNYPGGRYGYSMRSNENSIYIFGGSGVDEDDKKGLLNDLWMYNKNTKEWTWLSGNSTINKHGVYGSKGDPSVYNYPGSRESHTMISNEDVVYIFGGRGYPGGYGYPSYLNDLWMYNISTTEWTWLSGYSSINHRGVYGTKGVSNTSNYPGSRFTHSMTPNGESIFVFGGYGYAEDGSGKLNDLWMYNIDTTEWTWVSGNSTRNELGVYGTKGFSSKYNYPGARNGHSMISNEDFIFLFGGLGGGYLNDLWMYSKNIYAGLCFGKYSANDDVCSGNGVCVDEDDCCCDFGCSGPECGECYCYEILGTDPAVCSEHGSCTGFDVCTCDPGWYGDECESEYYCYGIPASNSSVCFGYGVCIGNDICDCDPGYGGDSCSSCVPACDPPCDNGKCVAENTCNCSDCWTGTLCDVFDNSTCLCPTCPEIPVCDDPPCSSEEECTAPNVCTPIPCCVNLTTCEADLEDCQNPNCDPVCENGGSCVATNFCNCTSEYTGKTCSTPICTDCHHGSCDDPDVCTCSPGWSGGNCGTPICSQGCVNGACNSPDYCQCISEYHGANCTEPVCFHLPSSSEKVCHGHGSCVAPGDCDCDLQYEGVWCNDWNCSGILRSLAGVVCNGKGICHEPENCDCLNGWDGVNCDIPTQETLEECEEDKTEILANFTLCNNPEEPCTPNCVHGECYTDNFPDTSCACEAGWTGDDCSITVCSPSCLHGDCDTNVPGVCNCTETGYTGILCEIPVCDDPPCSSEEECTAPGVCTPIPCCVNLTNCEDDLETCDVELETCEDDLDVCIIDNSTCNGELETCTSGWDNCTGDLGTCETDLEECLDIVCDDPVCSSHGECVADDTCVCDQGWEGDDCGTSKCPLGCSGNGVCVADDLCVCDLNHTGPTCAQFVCSPSCIHGTCNSGYTCTCTSGWGGPRCLDPICDGKYYPDPTLCNGHGSCTDPGHCNCDDGYTGKYCDIPVCFNIPATSLRVCHGHGQCTDNDTCVCDNYSKYYGDECNEWDCYGIPSTSTDPYPCSGNGTCDSFDDCDCDDGFGGDKCDNPLEVDLGICNDSLAVCKAKVDGCKDPVTCDPACVNGECYCDPNDISTGLCDCFKGWNGDNCSEPICDPECIAPNGYCSAPGYCTCTSGKWEGSLCEIPVCDSCTPDEECLEPQNCTTIPCCAARDFWIAEYNQCDADLGICNDTLGICTDELGTCTGELDECTENFETCTDDLEERTDELLNCTGDLDACQIDLLECNTTGLVCNITELVCEECPTGNSHCLFDEFLNQVCVCNQGYYKINDECHPIYVCHGIHAFDPDVCGGHGDCWGTPIEDAECWCDDGYYYNNETCACEIYTCEGIAYNDPDVCNGQGDCLPTVTGYECTCDHGFTNGPGSEDCAYSLCNDTASYDPTVCNGHGFCEEPEMCVCQEGYTGSYCEEESCPFGFTNPPACDQFIYCFGDRYDKESVCSNHGDCIGPDECGCECKYYGPNCQYKRGIRRHDDPTDTRTSEEIKQEGKEYKKLCKEKKWWKCKCKKKWTKHCKKIFNDFSWNQF